MKRFMVGNGPKPGVVSKGSSWGGGGCFATLLKGAAVGVITAIALHRR